MPEQLYVVDHVDAARVDVLEQRIDDGHFTARRREMQWHVARLDPECI